MDKTRKNARHSGKSPIELSVVADLTESEGEITARLLDVPQDGSCVIYFDCPGGSPYTALSLTSLMMMRGIKATGVVTGECSSAALWPFAACKRRVVTPLSILLFHPMKWQSEEHVMLPEAAEWARHFGKLEHEMDRLLAELFDWPLERLEAWMRPGRYVTGAELASQGLAELVDLGRLNLSSRNGAARRPTNSPVARPSRS